MLMPSPIMKPLPSTQEGHSGITVMRGGKLRKGRGALDGAVDSNVVFAKLRSQQTRREEDPPKVATKAVLISLA
jgi:hypothetical protein